MKKEISATISFAEAVEYLLRLSECVQRHFNEETQEHKKISGLLIEFFQCAACGGDKLADGAYILHPDSAICEEAHQKLIEIADYILEILPESESVKNKFN